MANQNSIGACWTEEAKIGTIEINGEKHQIAIVPNKFKKTEKHPDFEIKLVSKIGALWNKQNKSGGTYQHGVIEFGDDKVRVVVFTNNDKSKETQPDVTIKEVMTSEPQF